MKSLPMLLEKARKERLENTRKQKRLKELKEQLRIETEAKFQMQFERIREKEEHLKMREDERARSQEIKRLRAKRNIELKRENWLSGLRMHVWHRSNC